MGIVRKFFRGLFLFLLTGILVAVLSILGAIYFYVDGISAVAGFAVNQLPPSIDKEVGAYARIEFLRNCQIDEQKTKQLNIFYRTLNFDENTELYVVKDKTFNAFALPDNSIFVNDEVLKKVNSYPELAALLAHEHIHIKNRHGMKAIANSVSRDLFTSIIIGGDNSAVFIKNANMLLSLKNDRVFETESDIQGLELLASHRTDVTGMIKLFQRIKSISDKEAEHLPAYLSTHPDINDRLTAVEKSINSKANDFLHNDKLNYIFSELTRY